MKALVALALLLTCAAPAQAARRFALVIGENAGDAGDEKLRYAVEDARRMARALREVGGVADPDGFALLGATDAAVRAALSRLEARLAEANDPGAQLVIYVSSHAEEGELHLASTRLPMRELSDFIARAPVSVGILIIDSCRSGSVTRLKGLKPLPGTSVNVESPAVAGRVIITSSGADEYSQESDAIGGSYFTLHLVSAMCGAADLSRDGQVTLQEAYAWSYARTVESTFATRGGAQHPSYHVDLKGSGDLILAEPGRARGRLAIQVAAPGEWLVLSGDGGSVIGQFDKPEGPASFAVAPGSYRLRARAEDGFREARVVVPEGREALVSEVDLTRGVLVAGLLKGRRPISWSAAAGGWAGSGVLRQLDLLAGGELRLGVDGLRTAFNWIALSLAYGQGRASGEPRFLHRETRLRLESGRAWTLDRFRLRAGLGAAGVLARQELAPEDRVGLEAELSAVVAAELRVLGDMSIYLAAGAGPALVQLDAAREVRFQASASLGAALGF